jgi:D-lactate dehydrogenase
MQPAIISHTKETPPQGQDGKSTTKIFSFHAFEAPYYPFDKGFSMTPERLTIDTCHLAKGSKSICLFTSDDASAPVLTELHKIGVRSISLRSAGYNHVDLQRAAELGIKVANVPAYSPNAIAEHAVAMMLALNRKLVIADNRIKRHDFRLEGLIGFDMNHKKVGIIGLGFIGKVVAKILHGFGCELIGYDINPCQELTDKYGLVYSDLDTLCRESDIISLHLPLTSQTKYLIDTNRINLMKKGVMLINTARGGIVDTAAIIEGIKSGHIGSFGMDVYEKEAGVFFYDYSNCVLKDDQLALLTTYQNVLITAHQAFLTDTALKNISDTTAYNLQCWSEGRNSENLLN